YIQTARLHNADIRKYIKHLFISGEIGISKPNKGFFDYVLSHIDEKDKSKILVVGDSLTSDIKGAIDCGLDSVYIGTEPNEATYNVSELLELKRIL
ncbi:MAG: HAD-IA family hydrolase, partial [Clostridia bacterium]|nr:HAD-IA family hydrolase [Clostridia bacterium]